uniref:Mitoguardin n=1 Tax=Panagrellus redivivus TaxID=6233 RepID=A0A7E4VI94_PANRE
MSKLIADLSWPPPKRLVFTVLGVAGGVALLEYVRRKYATPEAEVLTHRRASKTPDESEAIANLDLTIQYLEKLLADLEKEKAESETARNRYDLINSILIRLRGTKVDLHKFQANDFGNNTPVTEEIARTVWNSAQTPRAGTLSIFSDDTFVSAIDDFPTNIPDLDSNSISIDFGELALYREGVAHVEAGDVKVRKMRADICGCDSEDDFLAKVYCIRLAFDNLLSDEKTLNWLVQQGRQIFAELMRHDSKSPTDFFTAYDKLMEYCRNPANYDNILEEMSYRKVEAINLWDVFFDFVLLDSFDDMRKPPSAMAALFRNNYLSRSFKESTLNSLIWSMIKVKRQRLSNKDGFISHFYDVSQIVSPVLIFAFFGDGPKVFLDLCLQFKENIYAFVTEIFSLQKVRYTTVEELTEDIKRLLEIRVENLQVKISTELIAST